MPRRPRIYIPGLSVHVIQRGNNKMQIFDAPADYERFLSLLRSAAAKHGVDVHGLVAMTTHYHLIVTPTSELALGRAMHDVDGQYATYYNRKSGRIGTLWNGRYRSLPIGDERYWMTCLRYIELNPVRARMVSSPEAYRWSSYRVHAWGERSEWLVPHYLYLALGPDAQLRQAAYEALCATPLTEAELTIQRRPPRDITVRTTEPEAAPDSAAWPRCLTPVPDPGA